MALAGKIMRYVDCSDLNLIGDGLCATPYLLHLADRYNGLSITNGYCSDIRPLIDFRSLNIHFDQTAPESTPVKKMDLSAVFHWCNINPKGIGLHMCQGYFSISDECFSINDEPIPTLPITLPFHITPVSFTNRTIVISPFSRTDHQNNKAWLDERWIEVGNRLLAQNLAAKIVVVGTYNDPWGAFETSGFELMVGQPLMNVLEAMRNARLVMSVDNGISHLCHFGGIGHHLLLAPQCLAPKFVYNPRGRNVRGEPLKISVDQIYSLAQEMLS